LEQRFEIVGVIFCHANTFFVWLASVISVKFKKKLAPYGAEDAMSDKEEYMSTSKPDSEAVHPTATFPSESETEAPLESAILSDEGASETPAALQDLPTDSELSEDDDEQVVKIEDDLTPIEAFDELNLVGPLKEAIDKLGWTKPTLIQGLCLPLTTQGQDLAGFSQTGTGKTGVFLITIAHQILKLRETVGQDPSPHPKAMILAPTRELAVQIATDAEALFNQLEISSLAVYGGVDYDKQAQRIRAGVDVIVATPGRLKDYFQKKVFSTQDCCLFICDEADRMLDMGFIEDVEFFLSKLSPETQKLLFSATTNDQVKELAFEYLENPKYISANPEVITPERIEQHAVICDSTQKLQVMLGLLRDHAPKCSIIFTNTKVVAEWLHYKLQGNGIEVDLITGDLPQKKRIALIHRIKAGEVKALIATDVASRGLHISGITHVYNFDLPDEAANYVHRIGRTARSGASGSAYSLVCEDYGHNLLAIQKYLGENVAIQMEWFPEAYLQIEDKAGNPYKDQNFKGYSMKEEDSGKPGRRRHEKGERGPRGGRPAEGGERNERGGRPAEGGERGGRRGQQSDRQGRGKGREAEGAISPEAGQPAKGKHQRGGRPQEGRNPPAQQDAQKQQHGRNRHKKALTPVARDGSRPPTKIIAPKQPEVVPNSFFGLVKKILASIFPWWKKR
jgi:ATP-dependent RNA helicase RhlB